MSRYVTLAIAYALTSMLRAWAAVAHPPQPSLETTVVVSTSRVEPNTVMFVRVNLENHSEGDLAIPNWLGCQDGTVVFQLREKEGEWFSIRAIGQDKGGYQPIRARNMPGKSSYSTVERISFGSHNGGRKPGKYQMRAIVVYRHGEAPAYTSREVPLEITLPEAPKGQEDSPARRFLVPSLWDSSLRPLDEEKLRAYLKDEQLPEPERSLLKWFGTLAEVSHKMKKEEREAVYQACREEAEEFPEVTQEFLRYKIGLQTIYAKDYQQTCVELAFLNSSSRESQKLKHLLAEAGYKYEKEQRFQ